jgi:hypothetical protein
VVAPTSLAVHLRHITPKSPLYAILSIKIGNALDLGGS